ncbi:hypothetical protein DTO282F9_8414 [Paecilomyces variotii]|nr:hypothetical protein DTO282F9_8414 [Paecilomyces variotii]
MDPFDRLPWFVIRDILCLLPDLPTLHRLHDASPAIAAFLRHENGLFSQIVETIISQERDFGLLPQVQALLRILVFIWWRTSPSDSNSELENETNPLPSTYKDFFEHIRSTVQSTRKDGEWLEPWELDPSYADAPLPKSTPSIILCRLLAFSSRVRQIIHVYFHEMIARCMALKPGYDPNDLPFMDIKPEKRRSRRPVKPHMPRDIGPPSWIEEQRLLRCFLRIFLFFELRHAIHTRGLYTTEKAALSLQGHSVDSFWDKIIEIRGDAYQMKSLIAWLVREAGSADSIEHWMISASISETPMYCCPNLRPLTPIQLKWRETKLYKLVEFLPFPHGHYYCILPNFPTDRPPEFPVVYPLGVFFWDGIRVDALGFLRENHNVDLEA